MAVTQVVFKPNKAGTWTFQTDATATYTDAFLLKEGDTAYWSIGAGVVGTYQIQSAPVGTDQASAAWVPTPFNGGNDIANGGVSGSFTAPASVLFRVALTAFSSGSATVEVRK